MLIYRHKQRLKESQESSQDVEVHVDGIDVDDMTVAQLKQALDQLGINYKSNDTKPDLLALLESTKKEGD